MTQVTDRPAADYRARRAAMLLAQVREEHQRDAALGQVAPDATPDERAAVLRAWEEHDTATADPVDEDDADGTRTHDHGADRGRRPLSSLWPARRRGKPCAAAPTVNTLPPVPETLATIPPPGRPRSAGRARSWTTRLALIVGPILMVGGLAYSCGVSTGSSRLVQQSAISSQDAATFHLSGFPAARASAFGVTYLTLCWTHPSPADSVATQNRLAALAQMTSAGVSAGCGWAGTVPSPAPLAVTWDGSVTAIQSAYTNGAAAQLGFVVTTTDQRTIGVTVPIWMPSTTSTAGARVVGDVAVVPVATAAAAPTPIAPSTTDSAIAEALTRSVLVPFLRAWAASDPVQLNLVLARDASSAARTGMAGQLSGPAVTGVRVVVTRGDPTAYRDGDQITAQVTVDWATTSGGQRAGYSIDLRMIAGRWQVTDISGAAPDPTGGLAPSTTFAPTPATAAPAG